MCVVATISLLGCQSTSEEANYLSRCADFKNETHSQGYQDAKPIVRIAPHYPISAARDGIEGEVSFEFDISGQGKPININIMKATPSGVFDANALAAFEKWRYKPAVSDGKSIQTNCHSMTLTFALN